MKGVEQHPLVVEDGPDREFQQRGLGKVCAERLRHGHAAVESAAGIGRAATGIQIGVHFAGKVNGEGGLVVRSQRMRWHGERLCHGGPPQRAAAQEPGQTNRHQ